MKNLRSLVTVLVLGSAMALPVAAQWSAGSNGTSTATRVQNPFQSLANRRQRPGYSTGGQNNGPGVLSVPQVMPVARSHRDAMRTVFSLDSAKTADDEVMTRLDARRKALARAMRVARENRDMAESSRLLRELESLRQERLERLRDIAPPTAVRVNREAERALPGQEAAPAPVDVKPVLPIPTRKAADSK